MTDTQNKIIDAAFEIFSRYGVRRSTMGEVAGHVGISRQTLYAKYPGKDELVIACIRVYADRMIAKMEESWTESQPLGEVLDVFFEHAVVEPFRFIQSMPDSRELLEATNSVYKDVSNQIDQEKAARLAARLAAFDTQFRKSGTGAADVAEFVVQNCIGIKFVAENSDMLNRHLTTLKTMVLATAKD